MDRWPWKKKSDEDIRNEKASSTTPLLSKFYQNSSHHDNIDQIKIYKDKVDGYEKKVNAHDDHVKALEDEVKEVKEKLSAALTEVNDEKTHVKHYAKVADEAISGWEKAEAEILSLENKLKSVTLLKLAAEDKLSCLNNYLKERLDNAIKQRVNQISNLDEAHQQDLPKLETVNNLEKEKAKEELRVSISSIRDFVLFLQIHGEQIKMLEDRVKTYKDRLKTYEDQVNEKTRETHYAKLDEGGVITGWEKAEAEALQENKLKSLLENALKDHLNQITNLKEKHEQELNTKTKHYKKMKLELEAKIGSLTQDLESNKLFLEEARLELASAQKLNSLSDIQLKCMAESYQRLETRAEDLQTREDHLPAIIENLKDELIEERKCHEDTLKKYKNLELVLRNG